MSNPQTPNGSSQQTLLELIYALKGLAQTVELYHESISHKLDEHSQDRHVEIERLRDLISKNNQATTVLPITVSDRVEKLVAKLEVNLDKRFDGIFEETLEVLGEVRTKLAVYEKSVDRVERAITDNEETAVRHVDEEREVTGRIEVTDDGDVTVTLNTELLSKIWKYAKYGIALLGAGGIAELIHRLLT